MIMIAITFAYHFCILFCDGNPFWDTIDWHSFFFEEQNEACNSIGHNSIISASITQQGTAEL
jgi:hypothetical protein